MEIKVPFYNILNMFLTGLVFIGGYYINLPSVNHMDYASFTLHFEDTTQRKWRVPGRAEFKSGTWELSWEKPQKI